MQAIVGRIVRRRQTSCGSISVASTRRCTKRNVPLLIAMPEKIRPSSLAGRRARRPAPHNSARCKVQDKRRTRSPHGGQKPGLSDYLRHCAWCPIRNATSAARTAAEASSAVVSTEAVVS